MNDKRMGKIKQHFDFFINSKKYKVLSYKISMEDHVLSIKTKIKGQAFPQDGLVSISIPSENFSEDLRISFKSMCCTLSIEEWEYTVEQ